MVRLQLLPDRTPKKFLSQNLFRCLPNAITLILIPHDPHFVLSFRALLSKNSMYLFPFIGQKGSKFAIWKKEPCVVKLQISFFLAKMEKLKTYVSSQCIFEETYVFGFWIFTKEKKICNFTTLRTEKYDCQDIDYFYQDLIVFSVS